MWRSCCRTGFLSTGGPGLAFLFSARGGGRAFVCDQSHPVSGRNDLSKPRREACIHIRAGIIHHSILIIVDYSLRSTIIYNWLSMVSNGSLFMDSLSTIIADSRPLIIYDSLFFFFLILFFF